MDEEEIEVRVIPGRKFSFLELAITTLDSIASYLDDLVQIMCSHANWKIQRTAVADQMRAEIETIVSGDA